ncbi:outer membrane beta-barrel protein [Aquimarina agarivorans]|uniref:outer membrane beta-barrel protein n=1 Tax=Aquimarina agarivorans TaxID=980584 RepID=UPI000248E858|nr:outer membrane beta-barrel protein [Aquimarina agarivorans]
MKKLMKIFCLISIVFCVNLYAQKSKTPSWILGVGFNAINDSGLSTEGLFNFSENYNVSRPFKISVEKKLNYRNGIELKALLNRFKTNKKFNSGFPTEDIDFFAIDFMYKYYLIKNEIDYLSNKRGIALYGTMGPGISFFNDINNVTINLGTGINYPIAKQFDINFQVTPKISVSNKAFSNNYFQFELGVMFYLDK